MTKVKYNINSSYSKMFYSNYGQSGIVV